MSERIVPILLLIVFIIALANAYVFLTPNYVLVSATDGVVNRYATMFTQGGCEETINELATLSPSNTRYACIRVSDIRP